MSVTIQKPKSSDLLDKLYYEIQMFNLVLISKSNDQIEINARLESFLIHARNLIDFLEDNGNHSDDLTCSNFKDKNGNKIRSFSINLSNNIKTHINKHAQHLTTTRAQQKPAWNVGNIKKEINKEIKKFINKVPNSKFPTQDGHDKRDFLTLL